MPIEKKRIDKKRKEKKQNEGLDAVAMISENCHYLRWKMKKKKSSFVLSFYLTVVVGSFFGFVVVDFFIMLTCELGTTTDFCCC